MTASKRILIAAVGAFSCLPATPIVYKAYIALHELLGYGVSYDDAARFMTGLLTICTTIPLIALFIVWGLSNDSK